MNDHPKILIILTGGTIGSVSEEGVRGLEGDSPYLLLREFRRRHPEYAACEFDVRNPFSILSENLTCRHWEALYAALNEINLSAYRGVIITHGSDTLAYTAAAMGLLLRHVSRPIVLIASDRPVNDPRSNAIPNFRAAVDFIIGSGLKGVFVTYRRYEDNAQAVYLATRLNSADALTDEFSPSGGRAFGRMENGRFVPQHSGTGNPSAEALNRPLSPIAGKAISLTRHKIMLLRAYPGMDYTAIDPSGFSAVIQYGYHSATACTAGTDTSLLAFAERCAACGCNVWLGAFKPGDGEELYATSKELLDNGIRPFYGMSPEAAYAKAVLAYNLPDVQPEEFMNRCVYYEIIGTEISF